MRAMWRRVDEGRADTYWIAPRRSAALGACAIGALMATMAATGTDGFAASPSPTAAPPPESAIGQAFVQSIAVSPSYARTGLVVAFGSPVPCRQNCVRLWVSHDGGASWLTAKAQGWSPSRLTIAVDAAGHEVLYSGSSTGMLRSDDDGDTWISAGAGGTPTVLPTYAHDAGVVIASGSYSGGDYFSHNQETTPVAGSGGGADLAYAISPAYPLGGAYSPTLLVALKSQTHEVQVLRCTADFSCNGGATLPGPTTDPRTSAGTVLYIPGDYPHHGTVFADTPVGVDKSTNGGATFAPLAIVSTSGAAATTTPGFAIGPGYSESGPARTAYVAVMQSFQTAPPMPGATVPGGGYYRTTGGIFRTLDGGDTWSPLATDGAFSGGATALTSAPDGRLFAGYYDGHGHPGLLCSSDGGGTWHASCSPVGAHGAATNGHGGNGGAGTSPAAAAGGSSAGGSGGDSGGNSGRSNGSGTDTAPTGARTSGLNTGRPWWAYALLAFAAGLFVLGVLPRSPLRRLAGRRQS